MTGGLDIAFWSRRADPAKRTEQLDREFVAEVLRALTSCWDVMPAGPDAPSCGCPDHLIPWVLGGSLFFVALEHKQPYQLGDHLDDYGDQAIEEIADELASQRDFFLDFLCVHFQKRFDAGPVLGDRDVVDRRNAEARSKAMADVNQLLRDADLVVIEPGVVVPLSAYETDPSAAFAGFASQQQEDVPWRGPVADAREELAAGHHADALTDVGRALQVALRAAGFEGKTIGEQMKALRRSGVLAGLDAKLGEVVCQLGDWTGGVRNARSDAHHQGTSSPEEVLFALRTVTALAELLTRRPPKPDTR